MGKHMPGVYNMDRFAAINTALHGDSQCIGVFYVSDHSPGT